MSVRQGRINEEMTRVLSEILREVKDPRVAGTLISVTSCEVSADLKYAKAYYSYFGKTEEKDVAAGLAGASGFIRRMVAQKLDLRQTPEIRFIRDDSIGRGAHINELLKKVAPAKQPEEPEK